MFYLKYRPQTFTELDNVRIRETLGRVLIANNFSHAYLFVGPRGTGKTSAARLLAKVINCTGRKKGEEPCNKCDSCQAIMAGNSLDVMEIDAASNTGVDDIRDLREKVRLAPTRSKYKVYIIDEAHMLSTSAFNALLKTLEEPPEHVVFVLATTDPQKLPETVVSRCLVYDFGRVTEKELVDSLSRVAVGEKIRVTKEVLAAVAARSRGSFRDAHKLLEQLSMQSAKLDLGRLDALNQNKTDEVAVALLRHLVKRQKKEVLVLIEDFAENSSENIKALINCLISQLRDMLLLRNGVSVDVEDLGISIEEMNVLVNDLIEAGVLMRDCPVAQLPLEIVVANFSDRKISGEKLVLEGNSTGVSKGIKECLLPKDDVKFEPERVKSGSALAPNAPEPVVLQRWPEIVAAVKPYNHSLEALLRATRPLQMKDGFLSLEVFYKFHKERLEEKKNREILEKVVSVIFGTDIKVKFVLSDRQKE